MFGWGQLLSHIWGCKSQLATSQNLYFFALFIFPASSPTTLDFGSTPKNCRTHNHAIFKLKGERLSDSSASLSKWGNWGPKRLCGISQTTQHNWYSSPATLIPVQDLAEQGEKQSRNENSKLIFMLHIKKKYFNPFSQWVSSVVF